MPDSGGQTQMPSESKKDFQGVNFSGCSLFLFVPMVKIGSKCLHIAFGALYSILLIAQAGKIFAHYFQLVIE